MNVSNNFNIAIPVHEYLSYIEGKYGADLATKLSRQLASDAKHIVIAANNQTDLTDFKADLERTKLHQPSPQTIKDVLAGRLDIKVDDLEKFYSKIFLQTLESFASESSNLGEAVDMLFDFYHTSRSFGGPESALLKSSSGLFIVSNSGMFNFDLIAAINTLVAKNKELKVLDLGCSTGLGTYSVAAVLESQRQYWQQTNNQDFDYQLQGIDIFDKPLKVATQGTFTKEQIETGYYASDKACLQDQQLISAAQNAATLKYGPIASQQITSFMKDIRAELINEKLIPLIMDEPKAGEYKVKSAIASKISFQKVQAFALNSDTIPNDAYHIVSCFNTFDLLTDEGKAKLLEEATKKLSSGGFLFSDIFKFSNPNEFKAANPKCAEVIDRYFDILNNPSYRPGSNELSYMPGLLKRK